MDQHGAAPQLPDRTRRFRGRPRPELQHPLAARRHRRPRPRHQGLRARPGPPPGGTPLLPLAQEDHPARRRQRPGHALRRRHRRRPRAALLPAGHRGAHRGRAASAHPRSAPQGPGHRRGPVRRGPSRRPQHPSVAAGRGAPPAGLLLDHLAGLGVPHAVAGGDLNERPGGRTFRRLGDGLRDCWTAAPWGGEYTFPATAPDRRIDAVFVTEGVEVLGCGVPSGLPGVAEDDLRAATDHLPVLTALRVPATPA
ncbi:endonuclease/exonuclease/phosphatase family protein [Streptomyces sp. PU10]|uniref:endonuclease/exonuclease/phosphatase family protein n=1 Tax=Streptomyces sp. PU10 TaxID=3062780 RepID=UPI0039659237